jgi:hypothetical protein
MVPASATQLHSQRRESLLFVGIRVKERVPADVGNPSYRKVSQSSQAYSPLR